MKHIKPLFSLIIVMFLSSLGASAQVGVGTTNPEGALDVSSTTGGFVPPRMSTNKRDSLATTMRPGGTIIFNTTENKLEVNTGTSASPVWSSLLTYSSSSGFKTEKTVYILVANDTTKTVDMGAVRFRFSAGSAGTVTPQMKYISNPGATRTCRATVSQQVLSGATGTMTYRDTSLSFTTSNYSTYKNLANTMTNYETNVFYVTDGIDFLGKVTFFMIGLNSGLSFYGIVTEEYF